MFAPFVNSSAGFALALADLKVIMVSYMIDEFNFQQAIHEKRRACAHIIILLVQIIVLVNDICHNGE